MNPKKHARIRHILAVCKGSTVQSTDLKEPFLKKIIKSITFFLSIQDRGGSIRASEFQVTLPFSESLWSGSLVVLPKMPPTVICKPEGPSGRAHITHADSGTQAPEPCPGRSPQPTLLMTCPVSLRPAVQQPPWASNPNKVPKELLLRPPGPVARARDAAGKDRGPGPVRPAGDAWPPTQWGGEGDGAAGTFTFS